MKKEEFESWIRALLPEAMNEAVIAWTKYGEELEHDEVEAEDLFYNIFYIQLRR